MEVGLDVLTPPFHTSHRLQPLDVGVFAPYKQAFKRYRDAWVMHYPRRPTTKQILAMWVSYGLQQALNRLNIEGSFRGIGIWPYNEHTIDNYLGPSQQFQSTSTPAIHIANKIRTMQDEQHNREDSQYQNNKEGEEDLVLLEIQGGEIPSHQEPVEHYFVGTTTRPESDIESNNSHDEHHGHENFHER